jgi:hypothetical protein
VTRRKRPGFNRVSPLQGGSFAASFGRKSYGAATASRGTPVTGRLRSPPYPAAAPRQHPGQAVNICAECASSQENVSHRGCRALSGLAPPASTVLRIPLRGTRLRRAVDPGDLCQPSGPDGEGQATGQARNARGEPRSRLCCLIEGKDLT